MDRAAHAVSQLKGNMSSISNTLQSSRSTTSVLQQLAVILPIVLAIPQSLGMYLKCLSFPTPFTDVINKFMWIPNFDLSVSFSIPPYITLIFQFVLFVVAVIFVKSLLVADWITFARSTIRFDVMLVCYTKLIRQHLLPVVPSADMAEEIAKIIAVSRVRTRVEMLEVIRMECQARSVSLMPSSLLQLSRRVPLAPTSALQPFLISAASSVGLTITESDAEVFSDLLLAAEEEEEVGHGEAQSVGQVSSPIEDDVVVRVAPTSTEETASSKMQPAAPRSIVLRVKCLLEIFAHPAGDDKGVLQTQKISVSEAKKKDLSNEAEAIAQMLLDVCRKACAKESDMICVAAATSYDESNISIWRRSKIILSKPDMPNPEARAPQAAYSATIKAEDTGVNWIVQQSDSPGWAQLTHAANTVSRFSRMEQSHIIRDVVIAAAGDASVRRRVKECFLVSDPKRHELQFIIGRPKRSDDVASTADKNVGKTQKEGENDSTTFALPGVECCFQLSVDSIAQHRCPRHDISLIAAKEDRHLALKSIESGKDVIYRCAHANSHAYKRCAQQVADFAPCDVAELFVCPDDSCKFAICRTCWEAMPNRLSKPRAAIMLLESTLTGVAYTVKHLPGGLLYVLVITILQSLSFPVMQGSVAILSCHPSIRCNFQVCDTTDTTYLVAAILSAVLLAAYNLGLTGAWIYALSRRSNAVRDVLQPFAQAAGGLDEAIVLWEWFLQDDTSVLSCFYRKYEVRFVNFEPVFLLLTQGGRVIAVAATDPDSWEQLLAVGVMEFVLAVYWLLTSPFINPQLDALAKSGSCHQLLQLCWLGFYNYMLLQNASPQFVTYAMLATSFIYLAFVLVVLFQTVVAPLLQYTRLLLVQGLVRRESLYIQDDDDLRAVANLQKLLVEKEDLFRDVLWKRLLFGGQYHAKMMNDDVDGAGDGTCCFQEMLTHAHLANRLGRTNDQRDAALLHARKAQAYFSRTFCCHQRRLAGKSDVEMLKLVEDVLVRELDGIESGGMLANEVAIHAAGGLQVLLGEEAGEESGTICTILEAALLISHRLRFPVAERNLFLLLSHAQRQVYGTAMKPIALTGIDLSGADLRQLTLRHCDLSFANLSRANFEQTFFYDVRLGGAELHAVIFHPDRKEEPDVFSGHSDSVFCVALLRIEDKSHSSVDAIAPIGAQHFVSASGDETAKIWNSSHTTSTCLATLADHSMFVLSVACTDFGASAKISTGGADALVVLWSETGEVLGRLAGHTDEVTSLAFSPDGCLVASGAKDKIVMLWSAAKQVCLARFDRHSQSVTGVSFHPDGTLLASSSNDATVRLWEVEDCEAEGTSTQLATDATTEVDHGLALKHPSPVSCLRFAPDGMTIACAFSNTLRTWTSKVRSCAKIMGTKHDSWSSRDCAGHERAIRAVEFTPDGLTIVSGSADTSVRLWSTAEGHCLTVLQCHTKTVCSVAASEQDVYSCSADETIRRWKLPKPSSRVTSSSSALTRHTADVRAVCTVPTSATTQLELMHVPRYIATGGDDRMVCVWNEASGQCIATLRGFLSPVYAVAVDPLCPWMIYTRGLSPGGSVIMWDVRTKAAVPQGLPIGGGSVNGDVNVIVFSSSGQVLAVGGDEGYLRMWRRSASQSNAAASWDAVSSISSNTFRGFEGCSILVGHTHDVLCAIFSPNSELLVSGSRDRTLRLWSTHDGKERHCCTGHADSIRCLSWIPDSRLLLATGGGDNTVCTWHIDRSTCVATLLTRVDLPDCVLSMDVSSCGRWMIAGTADNQLSVLHRLWEGGGSSSDSFSLHACAELSAVPHAARFVGPAAAGDWLPLVALCKSQEVSVVSLASGSDDDARLVSAAKWTSNAPVRFNHVDFHM